MSGPAERDPAPRRGAARSLTVAGLLAALLAVSALPALRIGTVPVTLQILVVVLAALLLSPGPAALAVAAYLAAGAAGLPVFSGGNGGLAWLAGPTGGYLWGFLAGAFLGAALRERLAASRLAQPAVDACAAGVVIAVVYALGIAQLAVVAHLSLGAALTAGALPFVVPDLVKAAVAMALAAAIRRVRPGR